jgi:hypothetical protein
MSQFDQVHATKKYRLLTRKRDVAGNEYIYLQGVGSTAAGSWVTYDEAGVTALLDSDNTNGSPVAVAQAAVDATTEYGWYMIFGSCSAAAGDVADNGRVFASATAGTCDDAAIADEQVIGAVWRSVETSALATVQLSYPFVGVDEAA